MASGIRLRSNTRPKSRLARQGASVSRVVLLVRAAISAAYLSRTLPVLRERLPQASLTSPGVGASAGSRRS